MGFSFIAAAMGCAESNVRKRNKIRFGKAVDRTDNDGGIVDDTNAASGIAVLIVIVRAGDHRAGC